MPRQSRCPRRPAVVDAPKTSLFLEFAAFQERSLACPNIERSGSPLRRQAENERLMDMSIELQAELRRTTSELPGVSAQRQLTTAGSVAPVFSSPYEQLLAWKAPRGHSLQPRGVRLTT